MRCVLANAAFAMDVFEARLHYFVIQVLHTYKMRNVAAIVMANVICTLFENFKILVMTIAIFSVISALLVAGIALFFKAKLARLKRQKDEMERELLDSQNLLIRQIKENVFLEKLLAGMTLDRLTEDVSRQNASNKSTDLTNPATRSSK